MTPLADVDNPFPSTQRQRSTSITVRLLPAFKVFVDPLGKRCLTPTHRRTSEGTAEISQLSSHSGRSRVSRLVLMRPALSVRPRSLQQRAPLSLERSEVSQTRIKSRALFWGLNPRWAELTCGEMPTPVTEYAPGQFGLLESERRNQQSLLVQMFGDVAVQCIQPRSPWEERRG